MIQVRRFAPGAAESLIQPTDIAQVCAEPHSMVWVDVQDATDADLDVVAEQFSLHPLAMEDARRHGQRPKLEHYPDHAFVIAYSAEMAEVDIFIGPTWVVTVRGHNTGGGEWDPALAEALFKRVDIDDPDVGMFLWAILDELVDGYFDSIDAAEDRLEVIEERIFTSNSTDERELQQELFVLRRHLLEFRRVVAPMREVTSALLRREVSWIRGEALVSLQDVHDHVLRAMDLIDGQRELMGNAVDAHLAIISNNVNQVMKRLTAWGSIVFGATLVAGIYGMNFEHMPELGWKYGYVWALSVMAGMSLVLYRVFRRRGWL